MAQRTKQRLDDVKLTLQRLQRITSESPDAGEPGAEGPAVKGAIGRAALAWGERAAPATPRGKNRAPFLIAAGLGGVLAAGAASYALWPAATPDVVETEKTTAAVAIDRPERPAAIAADQPEKTDAIPVDRPDKTAALPPARPAIREMEQTNIARATSEAQELIDLGKVESARRVLADVARQSPEAALMLARSYDPNFLRLVASPDGAPDAKEAERWYRAWHEIASEKGLIMEMDRLERIIKAMK
jgi:hypothetical protein